MNKDSILYVVIGLIIGVFIATINATYAVNNNHSGMMRTIGIHTNNANEQMMDNNDMTMGEMSDSLKTKTGDEFDKTFLADMIIHHQGAIDMAKLAQTNAKHDEVKSLANDILAAQSKEIDMMQSWQSQWGYKSTPSIESHDMMNMSH